MVDSEVECFSRVAHVARGDHVVRCEVRWQRRPSGVELKGPGNKPSQQSEFKIANIKLFPARGELFIISS